jgi:hypothetical protein
MQRRERALWSLEHALSSPEIPLDVKVEVKNACAASLDDETLASCDSLVVRLFDVLSRARDALIAGEGAMRGNSARACADALHAVTTRRDAPETLKRRGKDVVEALCGEWCFAAARETRNEGGTSPVRGWKAMENFWMRWRTLTIGDGGLGDGSALGTKAKRTYDMVERAESDMRLPSDWESRVPTAEDIAQDLQTLFTDLCESGELMSFLSVVRNDISSGRYKVQVRGDGRVARQSGATTDSIGLEPHLEGLGRKLRAEATRHRQEPPLGALTAVPESFSSPPKRVHIAAQRKKNARTVEWDSQNDQPDDNDKEEDKDEHEDIAPTQQTPRAKPSPLTNLSWEEVGYRTPRANLPAISPAPRAALKSPSTRKKLHVKVKWTDAEVTCLHLGVQKYGIGNWAKILNDPTLTNGFHTSRTGVHLKDKWRTIQRQAR